VPTEKLTVESWFLDWLDSKDQLAAATFKQYKSAVHRFLEYLSERRRIPLKALGAKEIRGYVKKLRSDGIGASTINKTARKILSTALAKAARLGKIQHNPVAEVDPEKVDQARRDVFTPEQVAAIARGFER
jgi:site-specific recombinase XerD